MLLIISCHILQGLNLKIAFWINVGVQIFFFISGFLYGEKIVQNINEFYTRRIKKKLLPTLYIYIVILVLEKIFLHNSYPVKLVIGNFLGFGGFIGTFPIVSHTWFISYILLCYFLVPVFSCMFSSNGFNRNLILLISTLFFLFLLQTYNITIINTSWINNFILGYFYSKCCNTVKEKRIYKTIIFVLFSIIIPFAIIYQEGIRNAFPSFMNSHSKSIIEYGHVFLGCVLFIILYDFFTVINPKYNFVLRFSDDYSFYIYLTHQIFILKQFSVLFCTENLFINILFIILLSFVSGVLLKYISIVFEKCLDVILKQLKFFIKRGNETIWKIEN